jgi:CHAT domain-containing protein
MKPPRPYTFHAACLAFPLLPDAELRELAENWLRQARVVHLACHAEFDADRPLAACLRLPSGEVLYALEWLDEPVHGLPLVTLSACRAGEVGPLAGGETFGLVSGLLAAGARAVVAGLWPVADAEAPPLVWSFYRHLMCRPPAAALALAQREALSGADSSPLFWSAFALFGDALAVPPPGLFWRWLAHWRQSRHARRFPRLLHLEPRTEATERPLL